MKKKKNREIEENEMLERRERHRLFLDWNEVPIIGRNFVGEREQARAYARTRVHINIYIQYVNTIFL